VWWLLAFLALYAAAMMTFATVVLGWGSLHPDITETWAWGKQLQLGYSKHPPVMAWLARAWLEVMPRTNWSFHLLAVMNAAAGLAGVWMLAGMLLPGLPGRLASVLFLTLTPAYTLWALKLNANAILLSSWPWTAYFFLESLRRPTVRAAMLAGVAGALALLGKYYSLILLATLLGVALLHPRRNAYFRSAAPYLTVATGLAVTAPHLWWLVQAHFPTIDYALTKTRHPAGQALQHTLSAIAQSYLSLGLGVMAFALAFGRRAWSLLVRALHATIERETAWLVWLAHGPAALTLVAHLATNGRFATEHLMPAFFAMPVAFLTAARAQVTRYVVQAVALATGAAWLALVIASPLLASYRFAHGGTLDLEPRREIAKTATQIWHRLFHRPLGIVAGTDALATAMTFYSPDAPSYLMLRDPSASPWITAARMSKEGVFIACRAADHSCIERAERIIGERPFHRSLDLATRFLGKRAPPQRFELFILPPADLDGVD
jgi:hypothetical protein